MAAVLKFTVSDLEAMSKAIRGLGSGCSTMADAAAEVTGYLHDNLRAADGSPACVMVRLLTTVPAGALPELHFEMARAVSAELTSDTVCLAHLATNGQRDLAEESVPEEYALPATDQVFSDIPFLPRLLDYTGVGVEAVRDRREALRMSLQHRSFNVYLVEDLADDEVLLPNPLHRQIVRERGIKSVVSLVGVLPTGGLLVLLLQTRVEVPESVLRLLQPLATAVKAALTIHALSVFSPSLRTTSS